MVILSVLASLKIVEKIRVSRCKICIFMHKKRAEFFAIIMKNRRNLKILFINSFILLLRSVLKDFRVLVS